MLYEDAISRQAVLDLCERFSGSVPYSVLSNYDMLPSVNLQSNTEVLDKIRVEIEVLEEGIFKDEVLQIIDKYKAESEVIKNVRYVFNK